MWAPSRRGWGAWGQTDSGRLASSGGRSLRQTQATAPHVTAPHTTARDWSRAPGITGGVARAGVEPGAQGGGEPRSSRWGAGEPPAQVRSCACFPSFSWTWTSRRLRCWLWPRGRGWSRRRATLPADENAPARQGPVPRGRRGCVWAWTRLRAAPVCRSERVTGHRICPHCLEVRTYHVWSCMVFILKSPLNASEMDTLQKILNSVQLGYLNSPGGPAALLHGTSAWREAGGQWRGQLLEARWPLKGQWR